MAAGRCRDKKQILDKPGQLAGQAEFLTPSDSESIAGGTSGESAKAFYSMTGKSVTATDVFSKTCFLGSFAVND